MIYRIYGKAHKTAKKVLKRISKPQYRLVNVSPLDMFDGVLSVTEKDRSVFFNEKSIKNGLIPKHEVFPLENVVQEHSFGRLEDSHTPTKKDLSFGVISEQATDFWKRFIDNSKIPPGYRNAGLSYAGYILDTQSWCLPSWIWTNAALVRMYCKCGDINQAINIADRLITLQRPEGSWIVRFDYDSYGVKPICAPNDSAYIANNALLELFLITNNKKYLDAAELCGRWIIKTARPDGLVYVGYNLNDYGWQKQYNIVDIGFTAALFCRLYQLTKKTEYMFFVDRFIQRYIECFYIPNKGFGTSLDEKDKRIGGMFGRGQAWALEGLIPYYCLTRDNKVRAVINCTVKLLLQKQSKAGGWPYNITRPLMGIDCKATPIIAWSLWKWYELNPNRVDCLRAVQKAIKWCEKHTANSGPAIGGIFSYSTEGAIVHNMYTSTAFVYSCAYATEIVESLKGRINDLPKQ